MIRNLLVPFVASLSLTSIPLASIASSAILQSGDRVVVLGDSNSYAGHYIALLEAHLLLGAGPHDIEVINLGLPSETCSGLTEPGHPFPRPNVHERLDRALAKLQPDVVIVCYGMNDAIYHPYSEERFQAYQDGITQLIDKSRQVGAKVVLLTPPAFDPLPMKLQNKLQPADATKFAWTAIYTDYDDVLAKYAEWILTLGRHVDAVVDVHRPINQFLDQRRQNEPQYTMSGDGVHFNHDGHAVVARALLEAIEADRIDEIDAQLLKLVADRQEMLKMAWLSEVGHQRPGIPAGLELNAAYRQAADHQHKIAERLAQLKSQPTASRTPDPFASVAQQPDLPNVLLIGDSISVAYTLPVRELLDGVANVSRPPTNCGSTLKGLAQIDRWLGDGNWDVIHFNWGLHDLKYMGPDGDNLVSPTLPNSRQLVPLDQYRNNLEKLIERLSETGATLIWCTTTPVPEGATGRFPGDEARYNAVAGELMKQHDVKINDLNALAAPRLSSIQRPANVHFTAEGSDQLAEQVATVIRRSLQNDDAKTQGEATPASNARTPLNVTGQPAR